MINKKKATIIICALNEERNIGQLLDDILKQDNNSDISIESIIVVSDGSIDATDQIVKEKMVKNPLISLYRNPERIGKIFSLGKAFTKTESDIVILFDADVRLDPNTITEILQPFEDNKYDLIGGNPVPTNLPQNPFQFAEHASYFSWALLKNIKNKNSRSIYCAHGRILALAKSIYKSIDLNKLSSPGDDQYIYIQSKNFYYAEEAKIYYKAPTSISDYLKQNVRFRTAKSLRGVVCKEIADSLFKIKDKYKIFYRTLMSNPYSGLVWFCLYCCGFIKYHTTHKKSTGALWEISNSTK